MPEFSVGSQRFPTLPTDLNCKMRTGGIVLKNLVFLMALWLENVAINYRASMIVIFMVQTKLISFRRGFSSSRVCISVQRSLSVQSHVRFLGSTIESHWWKGYILFSFNSIDWQTHFVAMMRADSTERETSVKINQSKLHTKSIAKLVHDYACILHGV